MPVVGDLPTAEIGRVKANGTTAEPHNYNLSDLNLPNGTYYYRLRQTDFDGSEQFSATVSVKLSNGKSGICVFPNPTADKIFIQNAENTEGGILTDYVGRIVQNFQKLPSEISLGDLPSGVYFLKTSGENFKIIKTH